MKKILDRNLPINYLIAIGLFLGLSSWAVAEQISYRSYHPSPSGNYQELRVTQQAHFATQAGRLGVGTSTAPQAALHVLSDTSSDMLRIDLMDAWPWSPVPAYRRRSIIMNPFGHLGIGDHGNIEAIYGTFPSHALDIYGDITLQEFSISGSAREVFVDRTGQITGVLPSSAGINSGPIQALSCTDNLSCTVTCPFEYSITGCAVGSAATTYQITGANQCTFNGTGSVTGIAWCVRFPQ